MMDFIIVPLVVGICVAGVYGLFELFVRRRERLTIIEKIGDKLDASAFEGKLGLPSYASKRFSFSALKAGCFLAGIGLGLLIAFIIVFSLSANMSEINRLDRELMATVYGASVLLFGGAGLLLAFVLELKISRKESKIR